MDFCTHIQEQIEAKNVTLKNRLASEDARRGFFPLLKPLSDNPMHFFAWAKEKFGADEKSVEVQQCAGHHLSCTYLSPQGPT